MYYYLFYVLVVNIWFKLQMKFITQDDFEQTNEFAVAASESSSVSLIFVVDVTVYPQTFVLEQENSRIIKSEVM